MRVKAVISVEGDPDELFRVLSSNRKGKGRSSVSYSKDDGFRILIEAPDVNAMRAAVNAHLLLIKTMEKVDVEWKSLRK